MNSIITSVCALGICLNITSDSAAADANGNIIVNSGSGMTVALDSKVNTGIDLGEGGDQNVIKGNGNIKTEARSLEKFKAIKISGAFDIAAQKGDKANIKITCDGNLLPHILSKISNGELSIAPDSPVSSKNKIRIELCISGEVNRIEMSGACTAVFKDMAASSLLLNLDGTSSATLFGKADSFEVDMNGISSLKADELKAKVTSVSVSGTCKADVFASEKLTANISGIGTVNYYGNPKDIVKEISLLGQLNKK